MSVESFLDSNIFVYHIEKLDLAKFHRVNQIIQSGIARGEACISFQVVQEVLNTVLRKATIPFDTEDARDYMVSVMQPLFQVPASPRLYHRSLDVQSRYQYSFYDSLIIAAALEAGCSRLITEDMQHGQRIEGLRIENPFAEEP